MKILKWAIAVILLVLIAIILYINFYPNNIVYYCNDDHIFYADSKTCKKDGYEKDLSIKKINNVTRKKSKLNVIKTLDEEITFLGTNCYGYDEEGYCYNYEQIKSLEKVEVNKTDEILKKIIGVWVDTTDSIDGNKIEFLKNGKNCILGDSGGRWNTTFCEYKVYEDKIEVSFEFTHPSNAKRDVVFTFNEDLSNLYRYKFTYFKLEPQKIKTTGYYECANGDIVFFTKDTVNKNESCDNNFCSSYEGTYSIVGSIIKASYNKKYGDFQTFNKYEEYAIINKKEILTNMGLCTYNEFGHD